MTVDQAVAAIDEAIPVLRLMGRSAVADRLGDLRDNLKGKWRYLEKPTERITRKQIAAVMESDIRRGR